MIVVSSSNKNTKIVSAIAFLILIDFIGLFCLNGLGVIAFVSTMLCTVFRIPFYLIIILLNVLYPKKINIIAIILILTMLLLFYFYEWSNYSYSPSKEGWVIANIISLVSA
jgi:hypothetical protein